MVRTEVEHILIGFGLAFKAIERCVDISDKTKKEIFNDVLFLAKELYPDFDPPPSSTKAPKMGN